MAITIKILAILLLFAAPERWSTTPAALYANAWAGTPIVTQSRQNISSSKASVVLKARESKVLRRTYFSWPLRPLQCQRRSSPSTLSSSLQESFDEPSTPSIENQTSIPSSTGISTEITNDKGSDSISKPSNSNPETNDELFFVRPAMFVDMDRSSKILADGFFKGPGSNWFKYQYEKFITYLSLEANYPRTPRERSRYEIYVACCADTGEVWGLVEIDARGTTTERTSKVYKQSGGSPYMCNLAVDEKQKRKGIATSLVYECERQVMEWHAEDERRRKKKDEETSDEDTVYNSKNEMINDIFGSGKIGKSKTKNIMRNSVCLKVRESNNAAVQMYSKLGYVTVFEEPEDRRPNEIILLMRKELSPL